MAGEPDNRSKNRKNPTIILGEIYMIRVIVYSMDMCPYCEKAKAWLTSAGIAYEEIRIDSKSERRRFYEEASRKYGVAIKSMPQVVIVEGDKETLIGGHDRLITSEDIKRAMP